jgi:lysophospholipid acyltransferase (LPLAT)-like uncharacterized protein
VSERGKVRFALGYLLGIWVRLWSLSWRVTLHFEDRALLELPEPLVYVFWHGTQMALTRAPRRRTTSALVSLSEDGALQSGVLRALGFRVVRGSSSRRGASGLKAIVRLLRSGQDAAFAVDGPRGPRGEAKPGAQIAARLARGACVPVGCAAERARVLEKAWDRFSVPLPFSRVIIWVGSPVSSGSIGPAIERANELSARALLGECCPPDPETETCPPS